MSLCGLVLMLMMLFVLPINFEAWLLDKSAMTPKSMPNAGTGTYTNSSKAATFDSKSCQVSSALTPTTYRKPLTSKECF